MYQFSDAFVKTPLVNHPSAQRSAAFLPPILLSFRQERIQLLHGHLLCRARAIHGVCRRPKVIAMKKKVKKVGTDPKPWDFMGFPSLGQNVRSTQAASPNTRQGL